MFHFPFGSDEGDCWFQQDWAMAHTTNSTVQMLNKLVAGSVPRSVTTVFLSLGSFEEEHVKKRQPPHIRRIKQNPELCISKVTAQSLH